VELFLAAIILVDVAKGFEQNEALGIVWTESRERGWERVISECGRMRAAGDGRERTGGRAGAGERGHTIFYRGWERVISACGRARAAGGGRERAGGRAGAGERGTPWKSYHFIHGMMVARNDWSSTSHFEHVPLDRVKDFM
jgi:hypothetical protein